MAGLAALLGFIGGIMCAGIAAMSPGFLGYGVTGWLLAAITGFAFAGAAGIWQIVDYLNAWRNRPPDR